MPSIRTTSNNTSAYPQDKLILRGDISHPTSVANEHREDAAVRRTIERPTGPDRLGITSQSRGACSSKVDGPTKQCRRTKGAEQTRHRRSKIKQEMQQARLRRPERPENTKRPENHTRNARVNPHRSKKPNLSCRIKHPSRIASRHRHTVPIAQAKKWHRIKIDVKACQAKKGAAEKRVHEHKIWYVPSNDPDGSVKGCVRHPVYIVGG